VPLMREGWLAAWIGVGHQERRLFSQFHFAC
jgi:hypothetical protein